MRPPIALIWKLVLPALLIGGILATGKRLRDEANPPDPSEAPQIVRIHQSDIRGHDAQGALLIRCRFCVGCKRVWHWAYVMLGPHLFDSYRDGVVPCPACNGTGVTSADLIRGTIRVVPDAEPVDYVEERAVRDDEVKEMLQALPFHKRARIAIR